MIIPPKPDNEAARLKALQELAILDTAPEKEFDEITEYAARQFKVPIAVISLVDENRQWFKSHYGIDATETSRDLAFCAHTILADETFIVEDTTQDARFEDNPLVTDDPNIRFYAGYPLKTLNGYNIGTLCVLDSKPRQFDEKQEQKLKELAQRVSMLLELRLSTLNLKKLSKRLKK